MKQKKYLIGLFCTFLFIDVTAQDSATFINFEPPTGILSRGDSITCTLTIENTGASEKSFWIGLSFAHQDATNAGWPLSWYDVLPIQTNTLLPSEQQTITFDYYIPPNSKPGQYYACASIWDDFDTENWLMVGIGANNDERYDDTRNYGTWLDYETGKLSFTLSDYIDDQPDIITQLKEAVRISVYENRSLEEMYFSGENSAKPLLYVGASVSGSIFGADVGIGGTILIDLDDLFQITPEGKDGWVTVWVDGNAKIGLSTPGTLPVTFGFLKHNFEFGERAIADERKDIIVGLNLKAAAWAISGVSYSVNSNQIKGPRLHTAYTNGASITLSGTVQGLISKEINLVDLRDALLDAFAAENSIETCIGLLTDQLYTICDLVLPTIRQTTWDDGSWELYNGIWENNLKLTKQYDETDDKKLYAHHFYIDVPENANSLFVTSSGGSGNADLFLNQGTRPVAGILPDYISFSSDNSENISVSYPNAGRWYIMLPSTLPYDDVKLNASILTSTNPPINENYNLTNYEYWFDDNYSGKINNQINSLNNFEINNNISAALLNDGIHYINFRFKDENKKWSSVLTQMFNKISLPTVIESSIIEYEYWFDNNYAEKTSNQISATHDYFLIENIQSDILDAGIHFLNIRFKDETDKWSSVVTQIFSKSKNYNQVESNIIGYEYWFDNNYSEKTNVTTSSINQLFIDDNIETSNLTNGLHYLHIRFIDEFGLWSSTTTQLFNKTSVGLSANSITGYRYWFNSLDTEMNNIDLPSPLTNLNLDTIISVTELSDTIHHLHIQFKDNFNNWSSILTHEFEKKKVVEAAFETLNNHGCDTLTVHFDNYSINANTYLWNFGDGNTSISENPIHFYDSPGIYTVSLLASDSVTGIDSLLEINNYIEVFSLPELSLGNDVSLCYGDSIYLDAGEEFNYYLWNTGSNEQVISISSTGNYIVEVTDSNNCINKDTINVTINPLPNVYLGNDTTVCDNIILDAGTDFISYNWNNNSNNQFLNVVESGEYFVTVTDVNSCNNSDSIHVIINYTEPLNIGNDTSFCFGDTITLIAVGGNFVNYLWSTGSTDNSIQVSSTGNYFVQAIDSNSCSNYDTVNVIVNSLPNINLGNDTIICDSKYLILDASSSFSSYLWNDNSNNQTLIVDTTNYFIGSNQIIVTVIDFNNCQNSDSLEVEFVLSPPIPVITQNGNTLASNEYDNYQWYYNGEAILNSNSQFLIADESGFYQVEHTNAFGCSSISEIVNITVGMEDQSISKNLKLYPNPNSGIFKVEIINNSIQSALIKVTDICGRIIYTDEIHHFGERCIKEINLSSKANGVYLFWIMYKDKVFTTKIIIQ